MKEDNTKFSFSLCFALEMLLVAGIAIATVFEPSGIVSLLFAATFLVLFLYLVKDVFINGLNKNFKVTTVLLVILCVLNVFLDLLFESGALSFDYLKKLIMFCSFVLLVNYSTQFDTVLSKWSSLVIKLVPVAISLIFIVSYFLFGNDVEVAGVITLRFNNPNATGMWLTHLLFFCVLFVIENLKKAKLGLLLIPLIPILVYMVFRTRARSCLVGIAAFAFLVIFGFFRRRTLSRPMAFIIAVFPFLFALAYLVLVDAEWFKQLFAFASSEGKPLNSRVKVWQDAFEKFIKDPLLGVYYSLSEGKGGSQLHNTHIDVLCSYGIIPAILFVKVLYDNLRALSSEENSWYGYISFCAFCAIIVVGAFEATMVSGSTGLNILSVCFLLLSRDELIRVRTSRISD